MNTFVLLGLLAISSLAAIEEAIATGAVQIDVEFDEVLGFPKTLYIDQDARIADEEAWFSAGEVVIQTVAD